MDLLSTTLLDSLKQSTWSLIPIKICTLREISEVIILDKPGFRDETIMDLNFIPNLSTCESLEIYKP